MYIINHDERFSSLCFLSEERERERERERDLCVLPLRLNLYCDTFLNLNLDRNLLWGIQLCNKRFSGCLLDWVLFENYCITYICFYCCKYGWHAFQYCQYIYVTNPIPLFVACRWVKEFILKGCNLKFKLHIQKGNPWSCRLKFYHIVS